MKMDSTCSSFIEGSTEADNAFFKRMLDLLPPHLYFDAETQDQLRGNVEEATSETEEKAELHVSKKEKRQEKRRKRKQKGEGDPLRLKTVSQLQEQLLDTEAETLTGVKNKAQPNTSKDPPAVAPLFPGAPPHLEDLRMKLHNRIQELRAKGKLNNEEWRERKRLKRRESKLKLKMKRRENKKNKNKEKGNNADSSSVLPNSDQKPNKSTTKPIYNKEGKLVFSKFDFQGSGKEKKSHSDLTGKDFKRLLEKVEKRNEKIKKLKDKDASAGKSLEEKLKWETMIHKAEGEKVKDNPEQLKKALKRKEKMREKKKKNWKDREDQTKKRIEAKQEKRQKNIQARKQSKKDKKLKQLKKKGRLIPGF